jgi:exodeoxyribonuclease-1
MPNRIFGTHRLLPYIVPAPGALLVTGVTVADITTCPLSHFEMMRQVHAKMHEWSQGGAVFVGWNSMRFDETMLRQAYFLAHAGYAST